MSLQTRQTMILKDIINGDCTVNCAGAIHTDGNCHCRCHGMNHGALWMDIVVVEHDRASTK